MKESTVWFCKLFVVTSCAGLAMMAAAACVEGTVNPAKYVLSTTRTPTEGGSVSPNAGSFDKGTELTLVASPARCYKFDGWAGEASGNSNPLTTKMNSDKTIVARFSKIVYSFETQVSPPSGGTLEPARGAYECGTQPTVVATAASGYRFGRWGRDGSGTSNSLNIMMDGNKTVSANFVRVYALTILSNPSNGGTISPKGGSYDAGSKVNLSLTPEFPYYPKNWVGADDNNVFPTSVTMSNDRSVTAVFATLVEGRPQKDSKVVTSGQPVGAPVASVSIQLNQFDWVQGEIIWGTNTPNTPVQAYVQDPAGSMVQDFGSVGQTNFKFMAQTAGPYKVVCQNNSIWWAKCDLTYRIWGKPQ